MKSLFFSFILLGFLNGAYAQETTVLTYEEVVNRALQENVTLKTEKNNLKVNEMARTQSYARFAPNISGFARFSRQNGNQFIPQQLELINTTSEDFFPRLSARLTVFNGFGNVNQLKASKSDLSAQEQLVYRTKQDIIFDVTQQFLNVLLDKELLRIAQENIAAQKQQLERIKGFVETGAVFVGDQYNQEAEIKSLELAAIEADNQLLNDKALLARILLLDPGIRFEIVAPNIDDLSQFLREYQLEVLFKQAIQNRADLKQQQLLEKSANHRVQVAKSNFYPSIDAFFDYSSYYNSTNRDPIFDESGNMVGSEKVSFNTQVFDRNPNRSLGLSINIPIFSQYENKLAVTRARVERENSALQLKQLRNSIYIDVQTAYQNYRTAKATYEAANASFRSAKIAYETQQERYKIGLANIIDLTTASANFVQASVDQAQAKYSLIFQQIIIDYQTGVLNPENIAAF